MGSFRSIKDITYVDNAGDVLQLDLHLPEGVAGPVPAVVFFPGGGWQKCDKLSAPSWLAEHGLAVVGVNYRVSSKAIAPANVHDCKAAVRWVRANAGSYGINPERIGVYGISAGGHLAALVGLSHGVAELEGSGGNAGVSSEVQAICDFCGPSDLSRSAIPAVRAQYAKVYEVTEQYLGGEVTQRRELSRLVSPLTYVGRKCPPILIAHGESDKVVPVEESHILYEALRKAGADVTLRLVEGGNHTWDWQLTKCEVIGFFQRALGTR